MEQFQQFILNADRVTGVAQTGTRKILIYTQLKAVVGGSVLLVSACDLGNVTWTLELGYQEFSQHQSEMGLCAPDWAAFFELFNKAIAGDTLTVNVTTEGLELTLLYPLAGAGLLGSLTLKEEESSLEERTELYFKALESSIKQVCQKRPREEPAEILPVKSTSQGKLRAKKPRMKKPKRIGPKLI